MNINWQRNKISDLCELIVDCVNKTAPISLQQTAFKMIRTPNIKNGIINLKGCRSVTEDIYEKWTRRAKVNKGDILLTREAPMGEVGLIDFQDTVFLGQRIMQYRVDSTKINSDFLLYSFLSSDLQKQFGRHGNTGSIVSHIKVGDCMDFEISTPTLFEQIKISKILSDIDQKIKLNKKINLELEKVAKTLYGYWFIQFDFPDENGKPYKNNGGKMEYSEELKRNIPKGWEVKKISDLLPVLTGKEDANFATKNGKYNFFTCGEKILKCDSYKFEGKAILVAGNGNFNVKLYEGKFNAYQRTYVLIPEDEKYYTIIFLVIENLINHFLNGSNGSIVKFIRKGDIEDIMIPLPKTGFSDLYKSLNDITKKIEINLEENQRLEELRDWLLPMLMNGQVSVK